MEIGFDVIHIYIDVYRHALSVCMCVCVSVGCGVLPGGGFEPFVQDSLCLHLEGGALWGGAGGWVPLREDRLQLGRDAEVAR